MHLTQAGTVPTGGHAGAACEGTYLSIQEAVEHRDHKALRRGEKDGIFSQTLMSVRW